MPDHTAQESVAGKRPAWPLPVLVRAAIFAGVWAPLLGLVVLFVPKFDGLFARLRERGELPGLTAWLMWFGRVNEAFFYIPCLLLFALVVTADVAAAHLLQRSRPGRLLYWAWFAAVIVMGIVMLNLAAVVLVLPVMRMSPTL